MKKTLFLAPCFFLFFFTSAQTCVGIFSFNLVDQKNKKPIADKLEKNIWYVFTGPQEEFYNGAEAVHPIDSLLKEPAFTVKHNAQGYTFLEKTGDDKGAFYFPTHCGLYLVQLEFIRKEDTMRLALYNIPAHQSFHMDTLTFKKGNYLIDFQGSRLMNELAFADDKGYFEVPMGVMQSFPKKKED